MPTISIIMPCYNTHELLGRTLDSLRGQSFQDFDIIIVNDGSTNQETVNFLNNLDTSVKVIHQENKGLGAARNTAIKAATGEYILPLDCDDWLAPTYLQKTLDALKQHPEAGFAFTYILMECDMHGVLKRTHNPFEQLFFNQLPYCLLYRKETWARIGQYDEVMRPGYQDWEFNIRLGLAGYNGICVPEPLFHYHISSNGMLKSGSSRKHADLWGYIQKKNKEAYKLPALIKNWRRNRHLKSSYPTIFYFGWLALFKILPPKIFTKLFKFLVNCFSASSRCNRSKTKNMQLAG